MTHRGRARQSGAEFCQSIERSAKSDNERNRLPSRRHAGQEKQCSRSIIIVVTAIRCTGVVGVGLMTEQVYGGTPSFGPMVQDMSYARNHSPDH